MCSESDKQKSSTGHACTVNGSSSEGFLTIRTFFFSPFFWTEPFLSFPLPRVCVGFYEFQCSPGGFKALGKPQRAPAAQAASWFKLKGNSKVSKTRATNDGPGLRVVEEEEEEEEAWKVYNLETEKPEKSQAKLVGEEGREGRSGGRERPGDLMWHVTWAPPLTEGSVSASLCGGWRGGCRETVAFSLFSSTEARATEEERKVEDHAVRLVG